jgi:hypothetical protein
MAIRARHRDARRPIRSAQRGDRAEVEQRHAIEPEVDVRDL